MLATDGEKLSLDLDGLDCEGVERCVPFIRHRGTKTADFKIVKIERGGVFLRWQVCSDEGGDAEKDMSVVSVSLTRVSASMCVGVGCWGMRVGAGNMEDVSEALYMTLRQTLHHTREAHPTTVSLDDDNGIFKAAIKEGKEGGE